MTNNDANMTQREQFEAWALKKLAKGDVKVFDAMIQRDEHGAYVSFIAEGAWQGWQAACPEGWQAVPKEPTRKMSQASYHPDVKGPLRETIYREMLSAAPKPGDDN